MKAICKGVEFGSTPLRFQDMGKKRLGFTLLEVMIVVAVIAILSVIAIPRMISYRKTSQVSACAANRQLLNDASRAYLIKYNLPDTTEITMDLLVPREGGNANGGYFIVRMPKCPSGGSYSYSVSRHMWCCSLGGDSTANDGYPHGEDSGQ